MPTSTYWRKAPDVSRSQPQRTYRKGNNRAWVPSAPETQAHASVPIALDPTNPTIPSNLFLREQTVRVRGGGFNAVNANPAASGCVIGNPNPPYSGSNVPCCNTLPTATNVCDSGTHSPFHDGSQCVEFKDGQNAWRSAALVSSVTPTAIVVGVPVGNGGGIPCMGGMGEEVHVSKWDTAAGELRDDGRAWCTNAAQKDLF